MAVLATTNPTLADVAKRLDPDGKIAMIVEILNQTNEVLDDMPWIEGNLPTGHRTSIRTGIPAPTWRKLYGGVQPSRSTTVQVTDNCGMLENYAESDKALADLNGNTAAFRLSEERPIIEGISQELAKTLFYGNEGTLPEQFTGLAPRFNTRVLANSQSADNVLHAGGAGSTNTSIWLVVWTPADVRAHAALKNMRELSGTAVDMAKVMRERPDLIDDSLPLSDGKTREAVMLARLSDEAFGAVIAGRLAPPFAALIGEHVTDASRHAGLLNEIAAANLANAAQARFYLAQLLELPTTTEIQMTLFGEEAITRIFGDFLFAEQNRFGGGLAETVAGPTVGNVAQALRLTAGNLQRGAKGEKTNFSREAVQFLGRNTPGSSLWYLRLGYERILLDQLQGLLDPEAKAAWRRRVQMQKRDYGNDFYWQPGELAPQRAPRFVSGR